MATNKHVYVDYLKHEFNAYLNDTSADLNETLGTKMAKVFLLFTDQNENLTDEICSLLIDRLLSLNKYIYTPNYKIEKILFVISFILKFVCGSK